MSDVLALLWLPFAASVAFVLIHAYLGVHVLRRNVVFADLALAQLSALGATVAYANGHGPSSPAGFAYALLFTTLGAVLLTMTRGVSRFVSREAFVGILYVVATAATILVVDRAPQGAEHVKRILLGSILTISPAEVAKLFLLYAAIGIFHWFARGPMLAVSNAAQPARHGALAVSLWDFLFFLSFGVVVASSVTTAGVLLVFSFLIVPAVVGSIFSQRMPVVLVLAWAVGIAASAAGLAGSYRLDLPTGATMVVAFGILLVLAALAKALLLVEPPQRHSNLVFAALAVVSLALVAALASSVWLLVNPTADQPLAASFESASGLGPEIFLGRNDRETFDGAARDALRFQGEVDRLNAKEKAARFEGAPWPDEEIRRIASYQQSFNEMVRGERFVQDRLRGKARSREAWVVGLPVATLSLLGLALIAWRVKRQRDTAAKGSAHALTESIAAS